MADQATGPFAWFLQSAPSSAVVLASFTWENDSSHRKLISHQEILKINAKKRLILIFYTTSVSGYLLQNIVLLSSRLKTGWCSKQSPALVLFGPLLTANIYKHFHFLYDIPPDPHTKCGLFKESDRCDTDDRYFPQHCVDDWLGHKSSGYA